MNRELWIIESRYIPNSEDWHPLLIEGAQYTQRGAEVLAANHARKYPKEPCRVVRYVPDDEVTGQRNAADLFCQEVERMMDYAAETMTDTELAEAVEKANAVIEGIKVRQMRKSDVE